jgi:ABC-type antimicrobial peptide transport system permease subunit
MGITDDIAPTVNFSFRQSPLSAVFFGIRTSVPPLSILDAARGAVASVDPRVPLARVETQLQVRDRRIAQERLFAYLYGAFAGLTVLLSCIGLYGLMAYNVTRRRSEIGVRVALGATGGQIARPILVEALTLAAFGVLLGVPIGLWAVRLIRSQLYGVGPGDPLSVVGGVGTLLIVALFAAWAPAHRASRVDPASSLQAD